MKVEILNLGMNGEGVGLFDGKVLFIPEAIKGEIVECEITKDFGNYAQAKLTKIITPSSKRQVPVCPYFGVCGGCDLQHISYSEQLNFKKELVKSTLKKVANIDCDVENTIGCNKQYNYRNKISFSCFQAQQGFKQKSSLNLVDVEFCPLANDEINHTFALIKTFLKTNDIDGLKNIVIRNLNHQTLIAIVTRTKQNLTALFEYLQSNTKNFGLFNVVNPRNDSVVLTNHILHIGGIEKIEMDNPLKLQLTVDSFFQTNLDIQTKLYNHILSLINNNDVVVNGYSGAGVLSAIIANKAKHVYGIEINKSAHIDAENLKKCNKIANLTNICGDFFDNFKNLSENSKNKNDEVCNTLVIDPSKKGCGKLVMQAINGIEKIIYVSCNPIALAKDLREIVDNYKIISITPFDMFPNTVSVETCVCLTKK